MSGSVVSASVRQNVVSLQGSPQETDRACEMADQLPPFAAGCSARSGIIAMARSARRSIAVSALALAGAAQASVLQLLR
jgi:hypothetical protein